MKWGRMNMDKYLYTFLLRFRGRTSELKGGLFQLTPDWRELRKVPPLREDEFTATYELVDGIYLLVRDESTSEGVVWAWHVVQVHQGTIKFLGKEEGQ
jgi:hypothetical protein